MTRIISYFEEKIGVPFFKVFALLLVLFFLWGFMLGLFDVLNKHLGELIALDSTKHILMLLTYYAGYLLMPIPASLFAERYSYKKGFIFGLLVFATGTFMFIPTSQFHSFPLFLFSLFAISMGMAALETVVNPYTTLVGKPKYATFRITLGQSFTSLGWLFGPFVGASILFDVREKVSIVQTNEFTAMTVPYVGIGILVVLIVVMLLVTDLPNINGEKVRSLTLNNPEEKSISIYKRGYFVTAFITMFFYMAAKTAVFGIYIMYLLDLFKSLSDHSVIGNEFLLKIVHLIAKTNELNETVYKSVATVLFIFIGMGMYTVGRFIGSFILIKFKPNILLVLSSVFSLLFSMIIWLNLGIISFIALCLLTLSISTMFPVIFSLGIRKMGYKTKRASAHIIMAIVGGGMFPLLVGVLPAISPVNIGLSILVVSFVVTFFYGFKGYKIGRITRTKLNH
ncbi:MAG: MFS transporter [Paludibacter sp.]